MNGTHSAVPARSSACASACLAWRGGGPLKGVETADDDHEQAYEVNPVSTPEAPVHGTPYARAGLASTVVSRRARAASI
jgi:hypothetical protein